MISTMHDSSDCEVEIYKQVVDFNWNTSVNTQISSMVLVTSDPHSILHNQIIVDSLLKILTCLLMLRGPEMIKSYQCSGRTVVQCSSDISMYSTVYHNLEVTVVNVLIETDRNRQRQNFIVISTSAYLCAKLFSSTEAITIIVSMFMHNM